MQVAAASHNSLWFHDHQPLRQFKLELVAKDICDKPRNDRHEQRQQQEALERNVAGEPIRIIARCYNVSRSMISRLNNEISIGMVRTGSAQLPRPDLKA